MTVTTLRRTLLDGTALNDTQRHSVPGQFAKKTNLAKLGIRFSQECRVAAYGHCTDSQYWLGPGLPATHMSAVRAYETEMGF